MRSRRTPVAFTLLCLLAAALAPTVRAADEPFASPSRKGGASLHLPPDINGPGAVLRAGDVRMKVTNAGILGNPFTNLSGDPAAMWRDSSGIEYLNHIALAVSAVDPFSGGLLMRRVSFGTEWGPPSADFADRIHETAAGAINGARHINDDDDRDPMGQDARIDEDPLNGRDDDGDGMIDEDFAAIGQQMYSWMMRDDGPYSEPFGATTHVPIGLEVHQTAWVYDVPDLRDFVAVEYTITNRSGHVLDSVYVGFQVDMDAGPASDPQFFLDDWALPGYPGGEFVRALARDQQRRQLPHAEVVPAVSPDSALCPRERLRVNAFSLTDRDGDGGATPGLATFMLIDHTVDPVGLSGPARVGFRAFRSFSSGTPWNFGGNPNTDSLRRVFLESTEGIGADGFIPPASASSEADYSAWCSVGPFLQLSDGASVRITIAFAVHRGTSTQGALYPLDYAAYRGGTLTPEALLAAHPALANAFTIQRFFSGMDVEVEGYPVTDYHGRETALRVPRGAPFQFAADCHDESAGGMRLINDREYTWFDFDCDYCTGAYDFPRGIGLFRWTWTMTHPYLDAPTLVPPPAGTLAVWPRPSAGKTRIAFSLPAAAEVRLTVHDVGGRLVRELSRARLDVGEHTATWDGRDEAGRATPPGVYLVRLATATEVISEKVVRAR